LLKITSVTKHSLKSSSRNPFKDHGFATQDHSWCAIFGAFSLHNRSNIKATLSPPTRVLPPALTYVNTIFFALFYALLLTRSGGKVRRPRARPLDFSGALAQIGGGKRKA
jgi:hypothetical protein